MASTVTHKSRRSKQVVDMTTDELREMIESLIDRKMTEWASDPRVARRRAEIATNATATRTEYRTGKIRRGTVKDLMADFR
jgi:hypothetical protein